MKIGILGRGFGLYGYLPAAIRNGWEPHTLTRYREEFALRPELLKYIDKVWFHPDEKSLISGVSALVCARNPQSQIELLETGIPFLGHLYLEKPVAPTILQHELILQKLNSTKQDFSVGYLFPFTEWYREILVKNKITGTKAFNIYWDVNLSLSSWKSKVSSGGGLANFYAIHFVTLLEDLGTNWNSLIFTSNENCLTIKGNVGEEVEINILIRISSNNHFQIHCISQEGIKQDIVKTETPFGATGMRGAQDPRISFLAEYMEDNFQAKDLNLNIAMEEKVLLFRKLSVQ